MNTNTRTTANTTNTDRLPQTGDTVKIVTHTGVSQQWRLSEPMRYGFRPGLYHGSGWRLIEARGSYSNQNRGFAASSFEKIG